MKVLLIVAALMLAVSCDQDSSAPADRPAAYASRSTPGDVLTISDPEVKPGQVVEVRFEPPPNHDVWGVDGELWQDRGGEWKRIAWTYGWSGKPKMTTIWPSAENFAFEDIGFSGSASWEWTVPGRLGPGKYELRKEWLPEAPASPDRPVVTERAAFTVTTKG